MPSSLPLLTQGVTDPSWREAYLLKHWNDGAGMVDTDSEEGNLEPPELTLSVSEQAKKLDIPAFKGLRTAGYQYVEYDTEEKELYDLKNDPYQLDYLITTTNPEFLQQLSDWLKLLSVCQGEECLISDQPPSGLLEP